MGKKRKQNPTPAITAKFNEGDLVGARVKWHKIWPGFIEKVDLKSGKIVYTVRFYGTDETSHQLVELKPFDELDDKERAYKDKGFQEALSICQEKYDSLKADEKKSKQSPDRKKIKTNHEKQTDQNEIEKQSSPILSSPQEQTSISSPHTSQPEIVQSPDQESSPSMVDASISSTQPSPSSASCCEQLTTQIVASNLDIEKTITTQKTTTTKKTITTKKEKSKTTQNKNDSCLTTPNKSTTLSNVAEDLQALVAKDRIHAKKANIKREEHGENCYNDPDKTLKKLEEKLKKKREEKDLLKVKEKNKKLINKASQKMLSINQILDYFSRILKKISSANQIDEEHRKLWAIAIDRYKDIMFVLNRCTEIISNAHNPKSEIYEKCHTLLVDIVGDLKVADKNDRLPADIKKGARDARQELKVKYIKNFINNYGIDSVEVNEKEIDVVRNPKRLNKKNNEKNKTQQGLKAKMV